MNYMTRQQVFDKVYKHLIKQAVKSTVTLDVDAGFDTCAYRGRGGTMCAAGCLIDDEFYDKKLEGRVVSSEEVSYSLNKSGVRTSDLYLVQVLQYVHDHTTPSDWSEKLYNVAKLHSLSVPLMDGE